MILSNRPIDYNSARQILTVIVPYRLTIIVLDKYRL